MNNILSGTSINHSYTYMHICHPNVRQLIGNLIPRAGYLNNKLLNLRYLDRYFETKSQIIDKKSQKFDGRAMKSFVMITLVDAFCFL
jgi:hypothetical protein